MLFEILVPYITAEPDLGARVNCHSQLTSTRFRCIMIMIIDLSNKNYCVTFICKSCEEHTHTQPYNPVSPLLSVKISNLTKNSSKIWMYECLSFSKCHILLSLLPFYRNTQNGCWKRNHAADITLRSWIIFACIRLRWSKGSVLAFSTQALGFKPGRSRRIFRAKKSSTCLPSEAK